MAQQRDTGIIVFAMLGCTALLIGYQELRIHLAQVQAQEAAQRVQNAFEEASKPRPAAGKVSR